MNYEESGTPGTINDRKQNMRIRFRQHEVKFDLSTFKMNRTNEDLFKNYHTMLNVKQLVYYEDSLESKQKKDQEYFGNNVLMYTMMKKDLRVDSTLKAEDIPLQSDIIRNFPKKNWPSIIASSYGVIRNIRSYAENNASDQEQLNKQIRRHVIEFHRKFTLSIACIILFFIGAPLGAIIRKGGLGMPVVISIFFFIFFHILSITGEKMAREGVLPVWEGMWLASMILTPIGIFFTRKATADSALFDINTYLDFFKQIGKVFTRKKQVSP